MYKRRLRHDCGLGLNRKVSTESGEGGIVYESGCRINNHKIDSYPVAYQCCWCCLAHYKVLVFIDHPSHYSDPDVKIICAGVVLEKKALGIDPANYPVD